MRHVCFKNARTSASPLSIKTITKEERSVQSRFSSGEFVASPDVHNRAEIHVMDDAGPFWRIVRLTISIRTAHNYFGVFHKPLLFLGPFWKTLKHSGYNSRMEARASGCLFRPKNELPPSAQIGSAEESPLIGVTIGIGGRWFNGAASPFYEGKLSDRGL